MPRRTEFECRESGDGLRGPRQRRDGNCGNDSLAPGGVRPNAQKDRTRNCRRWRVERTFGWIEVCCQMRVRCERLLQVQAELFSLLTTTVSEARVKK